MVGPCSMPSIEQEKRGAVSGAGVGYSTTDGQRQNEPPRGTLAYNISGNLLAKLRY